jgi:hypothetical protein
MTGFNEDVMQTVHNYNRSIDALHRPIILISLKDFVERGQLPNSISKQTEASKSVPRSNTRLPVQDFSILPKVTSFHPYIFDY